MVERKSGSQQSGGKEFYLCALLTWLFLCWPATELSPRSPLPLLTRRLVAFSCRPHVHKRQLVPLASVRQSSQSRAPKEKVANQSARRSTAHSGGSSSDGAEHMRDVFHAVDSCVGLCCAEKKKKKKKRKNFSSACLSHSMRLFPPPLSPAVWA